MIFIPGYPSTFLKEKRFGGFPYNRPLQNGGFVTCYISGSRCILNISVLRVFPIIAHFKMADS